MKSDDGVVNEDFAFAEVGADGGLALSTGFSIEVLLEKGGFAHTGVAEDDNFEEVFLASCHY